MSAAPNPISTPESKTEQADRLLTVGSDSPSPMTAFARWLGKTGSQVRELFTSSRSDPTNRSWKLDQLKPDQLRHRASRLKEEHPLSLLGVMAGTAFAVGLGARLWRSRRP